LAASDSGHGLGGAAPNRALETEFNFNLILENNP
jgi:hypothetical protein